MLIGITIAMVQVALVRRLVPSYGEMAIALACLLGQTLSVLAMFFAPSFWMIYPITVLKSATSVLISTTLSVLITNSVSLNEQGVLMSANTAISSAMSILYPLWAA